MATNICSRSRRSYVKPKRIADQYEMSEAQLYRLLALPEFAESIEKIGVRGMRIDPDKFYEIKKKVFG